MEYCVTTGREGTWLCAGAEIVFCRDNVVGGKTDGAGGGDETAVIGE